MPSTVDFSAVHCSFSRSPAADSSRPASRSVSGQTVYLFVVTSASPRHVRRQFVQTRTLLTSVPSSPAVTYTVPSRPPVAAPLAQ